MNKYLVHFDALQSRAYGVWWIEEGKVRSLYTDPEGGMAARGGLMVLNKSNSNVSWEDWFDQMTTRAPYIDEWSVYDGMGFTPEQMLFALSEPQPLVS